MDKKTKVHILLVVILAAVAIVSLCLLDYFNVFSRIGVDISNMNWDVISLAVGNIIVVLLFLITYLIVDSRSIQREKNQLMTTYLTLLGIYERCKDMVDIFNKEDLRLRAVQKCDGDKLLSEDKSHMRFLNYPFENESAIYDLAGAGILSKTVFEEYITIKKHYQKYINVSIVFNDHYDQFKPVEAEVSKELKSAIEKLKQSVEKDLEVE